MLYNDRSCFANVLTRDLGKAVRMRSSDGGHTTSPARQPENAPQRAVAAAVVPDVVLAPGSALGGVGGVRQSPALPRALPRSGAAAHAAHLLGLQRSLGNRVVQRLIAPPVRPAGGLPHTSNVSGLSPTDESGGDAAGREAARPLSSHATARGREAGTAPAAAMVVRREPEPAKPKKKPEPGDDRSWTDPDTGAVVTRGKPKAGVFGSPVPLPSSLEMRKAPLTGRGKWLTAPPAELRIDPTRMVGGILGSIDVRGFPVSNPTFVLTGKSNTLTGTGTVTIPTDYPRFFVEPVEVHFRVTSSALDALKLESDLGPLVGDITVTFDGDPAELAKVTQAMLRGEGFGAARRLGTGTAPANFSARGRLGLGTHKLSLPLAGAEASGRVSPDGVAWKGAGKGALLVPKGTFSPDMSVPGVGAVSSEGTRAWSGAGTQTTSLLALTGTTKIEALGKDMGEFFKPFLYYEVTDAKRTANGHVLKLRLSAHYRLGDAGKEQSAIDKAGEEKQKDRYRPAGSGHDRPIDPAITGKWDDMRAESRDEKWRVGLDWSGTFDLLDGK